MVALVLLFPAAAGALSAAPHAAIHRRAFIKPTMVANLPSTDDETKLSPTLPGEQSEEGTLSSGLKGFGETLQALQALRPRRRPMESDTSGDEPKSTSRLIVVSNRLPFSVKPGDEGYQFVSKRQPSFHEPPGVPFCVALSCTHDRSVH